MQAHNYLARTRSAQCAGRVRGRIQDDLPDAVSQENKKGR